jgi:hypothetical protein
VFASRCSVLLIAAFAGCLALQPSRALAQWWPHAPTDFEECADTAEKASTKDTKAQALAECNAKFAGRRKPGGGYTYYDFMQDRSFDIAGPNPTPEEQRHIDEQYTVYLENQRRSNIAAAFVKQQQMKLEQASLRSDTPATEKIPIPQARPKQAGRGPNNCPQHNFSCEWPKLSDSLSELKRLFNSNASSKGKKS